MLSTELGYRNELCGLESSAKQDHPHWLMGRESDPAEFGHTRELLRINLEYCHLNQWAIFRGGEAIFADHFFPL